MTREPSPRRTWRSVPASVKRMGRALPPVAWRDAELAAVGDELTALRKELAQLRRAAERRGPRPERWSAPDEDSAVELVRASGLFDDEWYLSQVDDLRTGDEPLRHYLGQGAAAGLSPHPAFVGSWYHTQIRATEGYGSRRKIREAPLLHYLTVGARRLLSPHPGFDAATYALENPESRSEPFGPLAHFLRQGDRECVNVEVELPPGMSHWMPRRRRTPAAFLESARRAATLIRDSRGHTHLDREQDSFDFAAEAELKASLLAAHDPSASDPMVTVVLPTKDRAGVVGDAVGSVLAQTYVNFELVIVDDGGQDDTAESLADLLCDPRIVYVRHEESRGVAAARNTALRQARGDLVAYLDSDNSWRPDFLEVMVAFMVSGGHRVGYAMSALTEQGGEGRSLFRGMPFSREALKERNYIDCITLVHERALLDETGLFDETLRRNVDWDLFIRMADVTDFAFLPVIATEYDVWETRTDRITTDEPPSYRQVVRQRTLVDWTDLSAGLADRDADVVSVVVVANETGDVAFSAVQRALATATGDLEVVVIDAHMPDHESTRLSLATETLPRTRVHRLTQELPLEVARNVGASMSRGGTLVFLAENTWCEPNWDAPLVEALRSHAAVQPVTLTNGGAVWSAGLHFVPNGQSVNAFGGFPGDAPEVRGVRPVDAVTSACLAVRADRFVEVGGFDPLFTNHLAGGELSLRLADHTGLAPACVGSSRVALLDPVEQDSVDNTRTRTKSASRDNDRFQRALWAGRASRLSVRLDEDDVALAGVLSSGVAAEPSTALLVRERGHRPLRWAIKIGAPDVLRRGSWGDWHFAEALRDSLERLGHEVSIDCHQEWYRPTAHLDDVTLVLRGLSSYEVNPLHTNLLWVISHPDLVPMRELSDYDLVFGASSRWCERVNRRLDQPAELLLQCTDHRRFRPVDPDPLREHPLLAVANARGERPPVARASVAAALDAGLTPAVYGQRWDGLLPEGAWQGVHLPNDALAAVYAAAGAVLNDHWDDMREEGLLSNRLFDLTACNARVISDHLPEIAEVFGDVVLTYNRPEEIPTLLHRHQHETDDRRQAREELGERVRRDHTFDARARVLSERVASLRAESAPAKA